MVLYKKKAGDIDRLDDRLDSLFLYVAHIAPLVSFAVSHARVLEMIGFASRPPWAGAVSAAAWSCVAVALAALLARQLDRRRQGQPINVTKLLFLAAATSLSAVLFSPPVVARMQYEVAFPIVTSFHNLQYLAIVWFYHQNRLQSAPQRRRPRAPLFARSLVAFLGLGLLFTVGYRVLLGCVFSAWPGCDLGAETIALPAGLTASDLGVGFLWGFALHHYYLDQKIWHVRRDAALSHDLRLDRAA